MTKFELAGQERIDAFKVTAREFFCDVLDLSFEECLVTDESRLSDFSSCGLPDNLADVTDSLFDLYAAWDAWIVPFVSERFQIVEVSPTDLLVELFEKIEARRAQQIQ